MANSNSANNIHGVLDYAVSQALLKGVVGKTSISVPISDLVNSGDGHRSNEAADGVVLKVEIRTSFDTGDAELETEFEEDPEEDPI